MNNKNQQAKILLGLKVKQLRHKRGLSFAELSKTAGLSVSYLNEIEKGKKYPKEEKLNALATALGVDTTTLTSQEFDEGVAPVAELLRSNFLNELPLDLFGIELTKVVEIIASAPARVGAFISTLLELSRNYALQQEHFYVSALRSYLELHNNYFPELEREVDAFISSYQVPGDRPLSPELLRKLLEQYFGYQVEEEGLEQFPELSNLRSLYLPREGRLLMNAQLSPMQRAFQYGKELAFSHLQVKERAYTSSLLRSKVFEEVLNHSRAIYFSVALHIPLSAITQDMQRFFAKEKWDGGAFLSIMKKYNASPEMFYHRLTNILPQVFGIRKMFFMRFTHSTQEGTFEIDRELHLNHRHTPHGNGVYEHYCRRWVSISLLQDLHSMQREGKSVDTIVRAQLAHYVGSGDDYLNFTIARPAYPRPDHNVSVTIGLLVNDKLRKEINFLDDPAIKVRDVHTTCERCSMVDCQERAAPPIIVHKRQHIKDMQQRIRALVEGEVEA